MGVGALWFDSSRKRQQAEEIQAAQQAEQQAQAAAAAASAAAAAEAASAAALAEVEAASAAAMSEAMAASEPLMADGAMVAAVPAPAAGASQPSRALAAQPMVPASELEARNKAVVELQNEVARLTAENAELRQKNQALVNRGTRPPATQPAAPRDASQTTTERRVDKPKVVKETTESPENVTRTDYRVYAVVDGQSWVVGKDGEPLLVKEKSTLPDGSRITRIDTKKHVVVTTTGTIR